MKLVFSLFLIAGVFIISCTKDRGILNGQLTDEKLFQLTTDTAGHTFYQSANYLAPAGGSPHGIFRLRFNPKAQSALDGTGELPVSGNFPDSSLLVKEVYDAPSGNLTVYAVMYKLNGVWNWAEYGSGGNTVFSVYNNANTCTNCHNQTPNRDQVRTFDLH